MGGRARSAPRRGRRRPGRDRARRGGQRARRARCRSRSPSRARRAAAAARSPAPSRCRARPATARGRLQQVTRTVLGEFVRSQTCPACSGAGPRGRAPVPRVRRLRPHGRGADARRRGSARDPRRPADPHLGRGPRGRARRPGRRRLRPGPGQAAPAARARGQRPLLHGRPDDDRGRARRDRPVPTLDGEHELELEPGTQPGRLHVLRGKGMPVLQGFGRGDQRVLVNVQVPRRLTEEQRRLLEEFERAPPTRRTRRTRGSSRS